MKKIIGLVVIIAVLVLGGYYGMGVITESTIEKNLNIINQSNGVLVDITEYKRGWYNSTALLNWRLHVPERLSKDQNGQSITIPAQDFTIKMPLMIYHGPIIFSDSGVKFGLGYARSDIEIPDIYLKQYAELFTSQSTKPMLNLSLFVNYLNNSKLNLGLPGFKLILKKGGEQFEWYGMDSHVNVTSSMHDIDGGIVVNGAHLSKDKIDATLGKVLSEYDLHQTSEGLYLGKASLSIPTFVVNENHQKILDLVQFDMSSSSDIDNGLFNTYFKTSMNKLIVHGATYGPATLDMSLKNLDAQILAEINEQANKMQQGTEAERQRAMLSMLPALPKLFSKGAELEISKLNFVAPEGTVEGNMLISLPKGDAGNPFQLLQKVQGHGRLKIPPAIIKEILIASIKQKLASQPPLQQAMVQQMQKNEQAPEQAQIQAQVDRAKAEAPTSGDEQNTSTVQNQEPPKPMTAAELEQQASAQADQKLSVMVQNGLLSLQGGKDYVIEISLQQGQLTINDKPFNPAMMQF